MSAARSPHQGGPAARDLVPAAGSDDAPGPAEPDSGAESAERSWPHGISRESSMRISDVLAGLRVEFPAISHSKLRFLEEQGLLEPVRTASGYRKYSPADVERLRFVLIEQRDRYLPLKVIKDKLAALDAGESSSDQPLIPRLVARDGEPAAARAQTTREALAASCGVETALVESLVSAGVVRPDARGHFDAQAQEVVTLAAGLVEFGIEPRHLRSLRAAADRQVDLVDQVVSPLRGQHAASARGRAGTTAAELGEVVARLHTVWVREGIADLPG